MSSATDNPDSVKDQFLIKHDIEVEDARAVSASVEDKRVISTEERGLVRKLDKRIMPIVCIMYLFACKLVAPFPKIKKLMPGLFFILKFWIGLISVMLVCKGSLKTHYMAIRRAGYTTGSSRPSFSPTCVITRRVSGISSRNLCSRKVICQVPAVVTSKLFPPRLWIGTAGIGWGICSTLMSTGFNFTGLFLARIGLGAFEACYGPGMPLYLSYFYTKHELGLRMAYFQSFGAVAGAISGLVAFGIQHARTSISNWRLLFIIEGIPSVLMGLTALLLLPDRPEMTHFLNEGERRIVLERINRAISSDLGFTINKAHIWAGLKDWRIYTGGVIFFGLNCAFASLSAFLPTIIKTLGFSEFSYISGDSKLLTVPPYAVAALLLLLTSYISDRIQNRGLLVVVGNVVSATGYLLLIFVQTNLRVRYFAVFCVAGGIFASIGLMIAWYAHNLGSETKRATGIPLFMSIGQCGSILGSHIFPATEGPQYIKGFSVTCALQFLGAICASILSVSYMWDNQRRDKQFGKPKPEATVDTSALADKAPMFRYVP